LTLRSRHRAFTNSLDLSLAFTETYKHYSALRTNWNSGKMTQDTSTASDNLLTICIVNYETSVYVRRCIESLGVQDYPWEAVIADNPSPAEDYRNLPEKPPQVRVVSLPHNVGYGLGCNAAADTASPGSRYICILNPDTAVPEGELRRWVKSYHRHCPNGGVLGPALHNDNGAVQRSSYAFYNGANYWLTHSLLAGFLINLKKGSLTGGKGRGFGEAETPQVLERDRNASALSTEQPATPTGWLMGAALLVNLDTWQKLGGFSDRYFLYSEDTDLCWRCHQLGLSVIYDPGVHIWHSQGDPAAGAARENGIVRLFDGMKRFVDENYAGLKKAGMYTSVITDMLIRLGIMIPLKTVRRDDQLLESRVRGYQRVLKQWTARAEPEG
jgi:GT2 family glycosyltransferase